jgi:hypothetical protein
LGRFFSFNFIKGIQYSCRHQKIFAKGIRILNILTAYGSKVDDVFPVTFFVPFRRANNMFSAGLFQLCRDKRTMQNKHACIRTAAGKTITIKSNNAIRQEMAGTWDKDCGVYDGE